MGTVTINENAIRAYFNARPLGGSGPGTGEGDAQLLAAAMVKRAVLNASGVIVRTRDGTYVRGMRPIVRHDPLTGATRVGVGNVAPHAGHLEDGTDPHIIAAPFVGGRPAGYLVSRPNNPTPLRSPQIVVNHPGNEAYRVLHKSVAEVMRAWRG